MFYRTFLQKIAYSTRAATAHLPTIYALSTPIEQKAAIAVVRISGSHCRYIYNQLTGSPQTRLNPRRALLKSLYRPTSIDEPRVLLDKALVLYFQSPHSFTGEDVLELHLHGGKAIVSQVLDSIRLLNDSNQNRAIRYATRGEFSMRAFQNGKFDLTELEGIRELIDAETESQRRSALQSFMGENKKLFETWRKTLISNIAQITAIIDFGDDLEMDNVENILDEVEENVTALKSEMQHFLRKVERASILQDGVKLALIGSPNTGKSSLINTLVNDSVSIVSSIPGTTRDVISSTVNISGYKVVISDTAGIRSNSKDEIELLGIERSQEKLRKSDLCLVLIDASKGFIVDEELKKLLLETSESSKPLRFVINKKDLVSNRLDIDKIKFEIKSIFPSHCSVNVVSCLNQAGIGKLTADLETDFKTLATESNGEDALLVSQRVKEILQNDVLFGIDSFINSKHGTGDIVLMSETLSQASDGIGKITGQSVGIEEILSTVFSSFCIGK